MGRKGGAQSISDLLDAGNRAGAKALVAWFADPMFPMSVPDLVVTGLPGYFVEVRQLWVAVSTVV